MKKLYICLTDFQILNALNLQMSKFKNEKADLFFITNKEGNEQLAQRLKETKIFDNIYLFNNSKIKGIHQYIRSLTEGKPNNGLIAAVNASVNEVIYKIHSKISGEAYAINAKMVIGGKMNFTAYNEVFCLDKRQLVVDCVTQILKSTNGKCKINLLDEGTSTYWRKILTKNFPINNIYLYVPKLANYYNEGWKDRIYKIPLINYNNKDFRNIINKVFQFSDDGSYHTDKTGNLFLENKIIFFDQNWDPMPEYFGHLNKFMKIILHNPYKKHKKESAFYERKMEMFRIAAKYSDGNDVIVKLHPRSPLSFIKDYQKSKCTMAPNLTAPWEVFMDNCLFRNNIWVTVSSTALCTYKMIFENNREDIPMIFLYKIVYDGNKNYAEDEQFFKSFQQKYPQTVFIPETIEEFTELYKKLIIKMNEKRNTDNE